MPRRILGKGAVRAIYAAIDTLFTRAKVRWLGRTVEPKRITFSTKPERPVGHREDLSLGGVFDHSSQMSGMKPNADLRESVMRVAEQYLDAHCELAKARVVTTVQAFLSEAEAKGERPDPKVVLGGELAVLMGQVGRNLKTIVETETTRASNLGAVDAITKVGALSGERDPVVAFMGANDTHVCDECRRLFFLNDDVTPRCWRLSDVQHGYHKRGNDKPAIGGCHPNCRHRPVTILPGYGFDDGGKLQFIAHGHDELARQAGM
jgi:hypothetical protein